MERNKLINNKVIKQCKICYEDIKDDLYLTLQCCKSQFHFQCLQENFNAQKHQDISVIICPNFDCLQVIKEQDVGVFEEFKYTLKQSYLKSSDQILKNQVYYLFKTQKAYQFFFNLKIQKPKYNINYVQKSEQIQYQILPNPIDDQIKSKPQIKKDCDICFDEMDQNTQWTLQCKHTYHKACLETYFNTEIQQKRFPLQCPNLSQLHEIQPFDIKKILNESDYEKYEKFQLDFYIDYHQKSQLFQRCLTPDCNYVFIKEINTPKFNCPSCYKEYCLDCNYPYHTGQTCQEYQMSKLNEKLDQQFNDLVTDKKFQKCSQCQMWVEKNQGCDHMTCRCRYEFCYVCGGPYKKCKCVKPNEPLQFLLNRFESPVSNNNQQSQPISLNNPNSSEQQNNQIRESPISQAQINIVQYQRVSINNPNNTQQQNNQQNLYQIQNNRINLQIPQINNQNNLISRPQINNTNSQNEQQPQLIQNLNNLNTTNQQLQTNIRPQGQIQQKPNTTIQRNVYTSSNQNNLNSKPQTSQQQIQQELNFQKINPNINIVSQNKFQFKKQIIIEKLNSNLDSNQYQPYSYSNNQNMSPLNKLPCRQNQFMQQQTDEIKVLKKLPNTINQNIYEIPKADDKKKENNLNNYINSNSFNNNKSQPFDFKFQKSKQSNESKAIQTKQNIQQQQIKDGDD